MQLEECNKLSHAKKNLNVYMSFATQYWSDIPKDVLDCKPWKP